VVSNGDDELLKLGQNRHGWHFPQMQDGTYAGYHPGDSSEAIAHLSDLFKRGAQYVLLPQTAYWWLDFYPDLLRHLGCSEPAELSRTSALQIFRCRDLASLPVSRGTDTE
jgi:hypothetical protein